jgi:succinate dehydrogenase / fumarate reductase cytochrome b subunit
MAFLGLHLYHGVWSMFQSVGWNHPKYTPRLRLFALVSTVLIVLGNISIPLAVITGIYRNLPGH